MRLPADHDEIAGEVAEQNFVLDLRVLCGTGHAEAHVPVMFQYVEAWSVLRVVCMSGCPTPTSLQLFSWARP